MQNYKSSIFSNKGFFFGAFIFLLGILLMLARVIIDINSLDKPEQNTTVIQPTQIEQNISKNLAALQTQLDKKATTFVQTEASSKIDLKNLEIFEHNPVLNPNGNITAIEFIDLNCQSCLDDAKYVEKLIKQNPNVRLVTKLNNVKKEKDLNIANIAGVVAANKNKFFNFKDQLLKNRNNDLDSIISALEQNDIPLHEFRSLLNHRSDLFLSRLSQDIYQSQLLDVNSYAISINGVLFSNNEHSVNKLSSISSYLDQLKK